LEVWSRFEHELALSIAGLSDCFLVISTTNVENYFVQFAAGGGVPGMRAEAVSNFYLDEPDQLTAADCERLREFGWNPPTDNETNFHIDVAAPVPCSWLAALSVKTLREVYRISGPEELIYQAGNTVDNTSVRLQPLNIRRLGDQVDRD
jgi:hypothetical protein